MSATYTYEAAKSSIIARDQLTAIKKDPPLSYMIRTMRLAAASFLGMGYPLFHFPPVLSGLAHCQALVGQKTSKEGAITGDFIRARAIRLGGGEAKPGQSIDKRW